MRGRTGRTIKTIAGAWLLICMVGACEHPAPPADWPEVLAERGTVRLDAGDDRVYTLRAEPQGVVHIDVDRTVTYDIALAVALLLLLSFAVVTLGTDKWSTRALGIVALVFIALLLVRGFSGESHVLDLKGHTYKHTVHDLFGILPNERARDAKELGDLVVKRVCADGETSGNEGLCFDFVSLEIGHGLSQPILKVRTSASAEDRPAQRLVRQWKRSW